MDDGERSDRARAMVGKLLELCPELASGAVDAGPLIDSILRSTGIAIQSAEAGKLKLSSFAARGRLEAYAVLGAISVVCDGYPDEDERTRAFLAGREVGEFWTQLVADKVAERAEATRS